MIPYEFHITVKCEPERFDLFKQACVRMQVKPLILDLHTRAGAQFQEMMTSYSEMFETDAQAMQRIAYQQAVLKLHGFESIRTKIETSPDHPMSPKTDNDMMPDGCYFESHLGVHLPNEHAITELTKLVGTAGHISRNVFKRSSDGSITVMATVRDYEGPRGQFISEVERLKNAIQTKWPVDKTIIEFILVDTSAEPDKEWLS